MLQALVGERVLRLASEQRSPGEHVWVDCRVLNTAHAADMHGNHECERRTRYVWCHPVQLAVLVGRAGGGLDHEACRLVAASASAPAKMATRLVPALSGAP